MANMLERIFSSKSPSLGSGLAENARQSLNDAEAYRQYVIDTQSNGGEPLPLAEWRKSKQG